jgi:hypothetical protein
MNKTMQIRFILTVSMVSILLLTIISSSEITAETPLWSESKSGLPTEGTYFGVTFGDMNNDGNQDIISASDGKGVSVFMGDGAGAWTEVVSHPADSGGYGDVAVGDYNSDGNLDIFASSPANHESQPTGVHVFRGDGTGGFLDVTDSANLPTSGKWRGVAAGDVNGDGHLDIAATAGYTTTDGIHVFLGNGEGYFSDESSGLPTDEDRGSKVVLADFNNDGVLDVAAGGTPGVSIYLGYIQATGSMTWVESSAGLPSERFTGLCAADVDNDGLSDLLLASYDAGSGVGLRAFKNVNNAASWISISEGLPDSGDYLDVSSGDVDGDGNQDMVSGGVYGTKGIKLLLGDGGGTWTDASQNLPSSGERVGCDVRDMNGDGNLDLLFGRYDQKGIEVWKNFPGSLVSPSVVSVNIADNAENVPINVEITISFNKEMDVDATESAISSDPAISWNTTWTQSNSQLTLTPNENLAKNTKYTITISQYAKSASNMNFDSQYQLSFQTGTNIDTGDPNEGEGLGTNTFLLIMIPLIIVIIFLVLLLKIKKKPPSH